MCEFILKPILADEILRMILSFFLLMCAYILKKILVDRKLWDVAFWVSFAAFVFSLAMYGYVVRHIYMENTFSYDGFVSGAAIITVCGLLFTKKRYVEFSDKFFCKNTPMVIASFTVFALVYLLTMNYNFSCSGDYYSFAINFMQIIIYPLMILFAITTFFFFFTITVNVFAICSVFFIIENVAFIAYMLLVDDSQLIEGGIFFISVSVVLSMASLCVLINTIRLHKEKRKK